LAADEEVIQNIHLGISIVATDQKVDKKAVITKSVTVLSVATPTKQKNAWLPLHAPANPSTRM